MEFCGHILLHICFVLPLEDLIGATPMPNHAVNWQLHAELNSYAEFVQRVEL